MPVVLGTLASRVIPAAERMAFDSALETGSPLIVANMLRLRPYPTTIMLLGPGAATLPDEEDLKAVRATADRAAALGLKTELLRISSPRPVKALVELLTERQAGLLVFGPDPERVGARRLRSAAKTLARDAPCLVWIPALSGI
ncbi:MAG: universal stress protein [Thermoleophilaceae bacterium]